MSIIPLIITVALACITLFSLGVFIGFMLGRSFTIEEINDTMRIDNDHIKIVTNGIQKVSQGEI